MRGILVVFVMALCEFAVAQSPTPKPSPALDSLMSTSKDMAQEKKNFQTILDQARSTVDSSAKQLQSAIQAKTKAVYDELKADKKYSGKLAEIDTMQKQLNDLSAGQQQKFQAETGPIQQKIAVDGAVIGGLVPVVRKENDFPDTATFDPETQTWKGTDKKPEPEPKKE